ncbi:MAG TPA: hypothetical protein VMJ10_21495 [Kofleriaceae bacterium]|nr:hypothetical protein [Kofleriaceae bacterium]
MNIDRAKLKGLLEMDGVPPGVRDAMVEGGLDAWIPRLRRLPAWDLGSAIAILRDAATDKPTAKAMKGTTIDAPFVHHGDLTIDGNLDVVAPFFVTGKLAVSGLLRDAGPDSCVAIGGDLAVGSLFTDGSFHCANIFADGIVYGHYNDQTLECMTIKARIVIEDEHDVQHAGVKAKLHLDIDEFSQGYGDGVTAKLKRHIKPEYFKRDDDEDAELLDEVALFEAIANGKDVWVAAGKEKAGKAKLAKPAKAKPAKAKPKKPAKAKAAKRG